MLHAMNARLCLASTGGERVVEVNDFYHGYKQFDLSADELLVRVELPLPDDQDLVRLYKVSRRRDMDISTFTAAVFMRLDAGVVTEARIAYGAVGPTVLRLSETEAWLVGQPFTRDTLHAAGGMAVEEITPITDVRGTSDYRYQLAKNVLLKFYEEHAARAVAEPV
ncbi:MAG: FAD binding domain-containing protein [Planctomycetota bacterium]